MKTIRRIALEILTSRTWQKAFGAVLLAGLTYLVFPDSAGEAGRRMAFIFVFAALFWALEIVPLYTTSLLVVLLEVFMLTKPGGVLNLGETGYAVFLVPFGSPIVMLFFGGLVLAAALSKYRLDQIIAARLLKGFGSKPFSIMIGFMVTTAFLSMWMSNTATTAMMIAMVVPLLKQVRADDPFRKALVLCIPFAANIGGIGTPVGTPPNAIAIGILANHGVHLSFVSWMLMAVPLAAILLVVTAMILYAFFPSNQKHITIVMPDRPLSGRHQKLTAIIAIVTALLWLTSPLHGIPAAVIALLAAGMFFGLHLLDNEDLKGIEWSVLVLMWGGLSLGKGLEVTGLTTWLIEQSVFQQTGFVLVMIFSVLGVLLGTFMSHTATANLLIPIVLAIPGQNNIFLAVAIALACSFAMALPISTPPNAIAFATKTLKVKDMFVSGMIISVVSLVVMLLGYKLVIGWAFGL